MKEPQGNAHLTAEHFKSFGQLVEVSVLAGLAVASVGVVRDDQEVQLRRRDEAKLFELASGRDDAINDGGAERLAAGPVDRKGCR